MHHHHHLPVSVHLILDIREIPPTVHSVLITTDDCPTLMATQRSFFITGGTGASIEEATRDIGRQLQRGNLEWVAELLSPLDRRRCGIVEEARTPTEIERMSLIADFRALKKGLTEISRKQLLAQQVIHIGLQSKETVEKKQKYVSDVKTLFGKIRRMAYVFLETQTVL